MRIHIPDSEGQIVPNPGTHYAKEIVAAAGNFSQNTYKHSKLPLRVFEAARIVTAVINGCTICMNWRTQRDIQFVGVTGGVDGRGPVPDEAFYQACLADDLSGLAPRERIAARYAQRMGTEPRAVAADEAFWAEMKAQFSDDEIVDLSYCIACWMGLGRIAHVLGIDAACSIPTHQLAEAA